MILTHRHKINIKCVVYVFFLNQRNATDVSGFKDERPNTEKLVGAASLAEQHFCNPVLII